MKLITGGIISSVVGAIIVYLFSKYCSEYVAELLQFDPNKVRFALQVVAGSIILFVLILLFNIHFRITERFRKYFTLIFNPSVRQLSREYIDSGHLKKYENARIPLYHYHDRHTVSSNCFQKRHQDS